MAFDFGVLGGIARCLLVSQGLKLALVCSISSAWRNCLVRHEDDSFVYIMLSRGQLLFMYVCE